jgi:alkylhydroperoxidase/carboxymuconolactone decarboxylase family protein YurZ
MDYSEWKDKTDGFKKVDVRGVAGNFLEGIKKQAAALPTGEGMEIVQTFEPIPLYEVMEMLGYEHHTEKTSDNEYHAYFYRVEERGDILDIPERPAVITNYPMIDEKLGQLAVEFWDLTWSDENRFLDYNTRLLLSLANAVGAGRKRQAMRELLKAYKNGIDSRALDDVFEQFAWNMGIGFFSSEIAPSPLFQAYKTIKQMEKQGKTRDEINRALKEKFSDKKPGESGGKEGSAPSGK